MDDQPRGDQSFSYQGAGDAAKRDNPARDKPWIFHTHASKSLVRHACQLAAILPALCLGSFAYPTQSWSADIDNIKRAIATNPKNADNWVALGTRLYGLQRYGESEWVMRQALAWRPGDMNALWVEGLSAYKLGDWTAAKDELWKLYVAGGLEQKLWPETIDRRSTYDILGRIFLSEGDLFSAAVFLSKACSDIPGNWPCQFFLGYTALNRGRLSDAVEALGRARSQQPRNSMILRYYARAKVVSDQHLMATSEHALHEVYPYPEAASDAAKAEHDFAEDEALVDEDIKANPLDSFAYDLLGEYKACRGQFATAVSALRKAIALDPTNVQARLFLAKIFLQLDPNDGHAEAESQLVQAIAINPDFWSGPADSPHVALLRALFEKQGRMDQAQALLRWQADNRPEGR
jgi:cytochrome c-type biogenesis protein CcmH/NrfG